MSVEDVDKVMWAGLGMRYAFIGPFETMHLNAEGKLKFSRENFKKSGLFVPSILGV